LTTQDLKSCGFPEALRKLIVSDTHNISDIIQDKLITVPYTGFAALIFKNQRYLSYALFVS
jgi:hypothetical protein